MQGIERIQIRSQIEPLLVQDFQFGLKVADVESAVRKAVCEMWGFERVHPKALALYSVEAIGVSTRLKDPGWLKREMHKLELKRGQR